MQSAVAESWGVPTNAGAYDPLLASLVHVTGLLGRPWSAEALSAGLPVPETGLTPELFVRAAARAGLTARVIARPLAEIPSLVLPAVLLLNERQACVLVSRAADGRAQVLLPESGGVSDLDLAELASRIFRPRDIRSTPAQLRCSQRAQRRAAAAALVLERDRAVLADLWRSAGRLAADQPVRARHAVLYDECVRPRRAEPRARDAVGAHDRRRRSSSGSICSCARCARTSSTSRASEST